MMFDKINIDNINYLPSDIVIRSKENLQPNSNTTKVIKSKLNNTLQNIQYCSENST